MAGFQVTEVQKALKGADYPMAGDQLADLAKSNGADDDLVEALRGLRQVDGPNGVMKVLKGELGGGTDGQSSPPALRPRLTAGAAPRARGRVRRRPGPPRRGRNRPP